MRRQGLAGGMSSMDGDTDQQTSGRLSYPTTQHPPLLDKSSFMRAIVGPWALQTSTFDD